MFFDAAETEGRLPVPAAARVLIVVLLVPTVGLGLWWSPLWDLASRSLAFIAP